MLGIILFLVVMTNTIKAHTVKLTPSPTVDAYLNAEQKLTCTTTYPMKFVFFRDDTIPSASAVILSSSGGICNTLQKLDNYKIQCDSVNGPFIITIKSITQNHNNKNIQCIIQYGSSTAESATAETKILVNVPVVINELTPGGTFTMNVSDTQLFQCSASGVPKPTLSWLIDGIVPTTTTGTPDSSPVTSKLTYTAKKTDNGKSVTCIASNRIDSVSANTTLTIQYVPIVEVFPKHSRYNVIENTTTVQLQCIVKEASPDATSYKWYKDNAAKTNNAIYSISNVQRSDDGMYTCEASNKVGTSSKASALQLNVLYGVILDTINTSQPLEGDVFSVTCSGQSNPIIENKDVTWTKQNNNTFVKHSTILLINNVNRRDSGIFICTVIIELTSSDGYTINVNGTTTVKLDVLYKPAVELSPSYNPYKVIENTTVSLQCNVIEASPNITSTKWYKDGTLISKDPTYMKQQVQRSDGGRYTCDATNIAGTSNNASEMELAILYGVILNTTNKRILVEGSGLFISCYGQSNPTIKDDDVTWTKQNNATFIQNHQQLTINRIDRMDSGVYICTVVITLTPSEGTATVVTGTTIVQVDVIYHPVVEISPRHEPYNVIENTTNVQLTCIVKEARPDVDLFLWKKDSANISTNATYTIPFVQITDGGNYTCFGFNKAGSSGPSLYLKLNVLYGVIVNTIDTQRPTEGRNLSVKCTGESYPPIEDNDVKWTKENNSTFKQSGQRLNIDNVNRLDTGSYICIVIKSLTSSDGDIAVVRGTTTMKVNVRYPPLVEITTNMNIDILENSTNLVLTCSVKEANPEVVKYKWYKDGTLILHRQNQNYMVPNVHRADAGYYICEGNNFIGASNSSNVYVNVLYGVTLNLSRIFITVNESEDIEVVCRAIGNPLPKLTWINTYNKSVIAEEDNADVKSLSVNANCIDTGMYTCIGNNSIGDIALFSSIVKVRCYPRTIDNKNTRTIVVNGIGGVLSISEVFISYPSSDISWSRQYPDGNNTVLDNTFVISYNKSFLPYGTLSSLYKDGMQREEFGQYIANSVNAYGSFEVTYTVIPKGRPDPPSNVSAICGITSVTVIWMSRFNGGANQTFQIYVRDNDKNTSVLSSKDIPDEGEGRYITSREESLIPNSLYEIYVEAKNSFGCINSTETVTCITAKHNKKESTSLALVGGLAGSASSLVVVCVAVVIIFIIHRRKTEGGDKEPIQRSNHHTDEDEDGLKDNPLYVTSEDTAKYEDGTICSSENVKTGTKPMKENMDEGPVYSKVEKKAQKGKKKIHAQKTKNAKNGQHHKDFEMDKVYENSDKLMKDKIDDEVYANASSGKEIDQPVNTGNHCRSRRNKDGLIYADLDLVPQQSGKRFVIRGLENRNNYAIIDLSKTAEPLPSDTEEEDET